MSFRRLETGGLLVSSRWPALLPPNGQDTAMPDSSENPLTVSSSANPRPRNPGSPGELPVDAGGICSRHERFAQAEMGMPPVDPAIDESAIDPPAPLLRTLYVTEHGSRLGIQGERFIIKPLREEERPIPALKVDLIILFGNVQVSTQAMHYCLKHRIPLVLAGANGSPRGLLHACEDRFAQRQRLQYRAVEDAEFALRVARAIVLGKIGNCRTVLQRYAHKHGSKTVEPSLSQMAALASHVHSADDLEHLLGFEGAAAKAYFAGWRELIAPGWGFEGRDKPAAADPINALLNFGYSLLYQNLRMLLAALGLNPAVGFLHPPRDGHAALASDMMEEFRAMTVDVLVFGDVLGGSGFHPDDFESGADSEYPCTIKPHAMHRFLEKFEAKMNSPFSHPDESHRLDYRRVMQRQCAHLAEVIGERGDYQPLRIR